MITVYMSRFWRNILFAIFTIGFFISAPLVVLYTAGYRYSLTSKRVVKAGVLSVTSTPKGATVTINGVPSEKKTPAVIDNILPGTITVKVEKSGYSSWEKNLPIVSGQSTFVPNAVLFLDGSPTAVVDQKNILAVDQKSATKMVYLVSNTASIEVWQKDLAYGTSKSVYSTTPHAKSTYTLSLSPDETYALLTETVIKKTRTLIRLFDGQTIPLPANISDVWWNEDGGHLLLTRVNTEIQAFEIDSGLSTPEKTVANDALYRDNKWLVVQPSQANKDVVSYLSQNGVASIVAYIPAGQYRFLHAPAPYLMLQDTRTHHVLLLNPTENEPLKFSKEMTRFVWSPKEDQLLFSNGFDINIYTLASGETETITRFSEPLTALAWEPIGDQILYAKNTSLRSIELDRRDTRNEIELANGYSVRTLWTSKDGASIYFFGQYGSEPASIFERKVQK